MPVNSARDASALRLKETLGDTDFNQVVIKYQTMPYSSSERGKYFRDMADLVSVSAETLKRSLREYITTEQVRIPKHTSFNPPNYQKIIPTFYSESFAIYGCAHIPYQNNEKLDEFIYILRSERIEDCFAIGDMGEYRQNSRHEKDRQPLSGDIGYNESIMAIKQHIGIVQDSVSTLNIFAGNHERKVYRSNDGGADWITELSDSRFDDKTTFYDIEYGFIRHPENDGIKLTRIEHLSKGYNKNPLQSANLKSRGDRGLATAASEFELFNWIYAHNHNGAAGRGPMGWERYISLGTFANQDYMDYLHHGQGGYPQWNSMWVFFKKGKFNYIGL